MLEREREYKQGLNKIKDLLGIVNKLMLNNILVHFKLLGEQINQEKYIYPITVLKNKKYHLNLIKRMLIIDNYYHPIIVL